MAGGWVRDGGVQDQIDASVDEAIEHARNRLKRRGESLRECEACEEPIPEGRQRAVPGVRLCVVCQEAEDAEQRRSSGYNRRGNKDSQLR